MIDGSGNDKMLISAIPYVSGGGDDIFDFKR